MASPPAGGRAATTTTGQPPVDRTYAVGVRTETYVDASRPTSANGTFPGAPDRTLPVTIWYPAIAPAGDPQAADAPPDRSDAPYPLVVFAHGYAVTPEYYEPLLRNWAAAGYVVAAPTYPILSGTPGGPGHADYEQTFADTSFVISALLREFGTGPGTHPLAGLVDPTRVAVAGHSDGEVVAYGVGFLVCCRDPRVDAVIAMAGILGNISNPVQRDNGVPVLHIVGEADELQPYGAAVAWDRENLTPPRWTVTLIGGGHAAPYRNPSSEHFDGVVRLTVDFFDGTLKGRPDRLARMEQFIVDNPARYRLDR
jgi:predicted dienelactone hydrolase